MWDAGPAGRIRLAEGMDGIVDGFPLRLGSSGERPAGILLLGILGDGRLRRGQLDELCDEVTIVAGDALCCRSAPGSPGACRLRDPGRRPGRACQPRCHR